MKRSLLIRCEWQADTFCALWLGPDGEYVLGWLVGVKAKMGEAPGAQSKLRYRDREQAALAFEAKLAELREMVL